MTKIKTDPNRILVFNPLKRLIAIYHSQIATANAFHARPQSIHYACTGKSISCKEHYFRQLQDDIEVTFEDLGALRLEDYDELCGVERKIYKTKRMCRTGMKYNKSTNNIKG